MRTTNRFWVLQSPAVFVFSFPLFSCCIPAVFVFSFPQFFRVPQFSFSVSRSFPCTAVSRLPQFPVYRSWSCSSQLQVSAPLLPDAEISKNAIQHIVGIDRTRDVTQRVARRL